MKRVKLGPDDYWIFVALVAIHIGVNNGVSTC